MEETNFEKNNNEHVAANDGLDELNTLMENGSSFQWPVCASYCDGLSNGCCMESKYLDSTCYSNHPSFPNVPLYNCAFCHKPMHGIQCAYSHSQSMNR